MPNPPSEPADNRAPFVAALLAPALLVALFVDVVSPQVVVLATAAAALAFLAVWWWRGRPDEPTAPNRDRARWLRHPW